MASCRIGRFHYMDGRLINQLRAEGGDPSYPHHTVCKQATSQPTNPPDLLEALLEVAVKRSEHAAFPVRHAVAHVKGDGRRPLLSSTAAAAAAAGGWRRLLVLLLHQRLARCALKLKAVVSLDHFQGICICIYPFPPPPRSPGGAGRGSSPWSG